MVTQASELVAGRELDARIAHEVMGFPDGVALHGEYPRDIGCEPPDGQYPYFFHGTVFFERHGFGHDFTPSSDIAYAWLVVERLRTLGWLVRVQEMPDGFPYRDDMTGEPTFTARALCLLYPVAQREGGVRHVREHRAMADSTPLAICRAALAAIEKD